MNKKGLSGVVAVVLIILLVLVAVAVVWAFLHPTILGIQNVDRIQTIYGADLKIVPSSVINNNITDTVDFIVRRGEGDAKVVGINVILEDYSGASYVVRKNVVGFDAFETVPVEIDYSYSSSNGEGLQGELVKISIAPIVEASDGSEVFGEVTDDYDLPINGDVDSDTGGQWEFISGECKNINLQWGAIPRDNAQSAPRMNFAQYSFAREYTLQNPSNFYPSIKVVDNNGDGKEEFEIINGGIPQNMDLAAHVGTQDDFPGGGTLWGRLKGLEQNYNGIDGGEDASWKIITFDYEKWRPEWDMLENITMNTSINTPENVINPYKNLSIQRVIDEHPDWIDKNQIEEQAKREYEEAARAFFLVNLVIAKQKFPNVKVGYYGFPVNTYWSGSGVCRTDSNDWHDYCDEGETTIDECSRGINQCWRNLNDDMSWFYTGDRVDSVTFNSDGTISVDSNKFADGIIDGTSGEFIQGVDLLEPSMYMFYPSLNLGQSGPIGTSVYSNNLEYVQETIEESKRIRDLYSNESLKIIPFTWYYYHDSTRFAFGFLDDLDKELEWDSLLGDDSIDGVIMWGDLPILAWQQVLEREFNNIFVYNSSQTFGMSQEEWQFLNNNRHTPLGSWFFNKLDEYNICVPGMSQELGLDGDILSLTADQQDIIMTSNLRSTTDPMYYPARIDTIKWDVVGFGQDIDFAGNFVSLQDVASLIGNKNDFVLRVRVSNTYGASQYVDYTFTKSS